MTGQYSEIETIQYPSCLHCKYCKFAKRNEFGDWKIKCHQKLFAIKIPFRYPQVGCEYYKTRELVK